MEAPLFDKQLFPFGFGNFGSGRPFSINTVKSYANDATKHIEKLEAVIQGGTI